VILARRYSIAGLMAVVLVASLGLAALRSGSGAWAGGFYLLTYGLLALALIGAACRGKAERAWWLGFALFGYGYLRISFSYNYVYVTFKLPTTYLLEAICPDRVKTLPVGIFGQPDVASSYYWVVGHCLWSLLAATVGGMLAQALFAVPADRFDDHDAEPRSAGLSTRRNWRRVAVIGLAGLGTVMALVLVASRSDPQLWAGALYLLTWVVLGFVVLGFACSRGKRRMTWFGVALFGLGYMILTRGPDRYEETTYVHLVADDFLISLRPYLPPVYEFPAKSNRIAEANARIRKALDQPVPMHFPDETALKHVLEYVRAATRAPDGRVIPIYVDPVGLQEAEKTMDSPIRIDLADVPLSSTLHLALHQLGMMYLVRDGVLFITGEASEDIPVEVDQYLLLGHCVLALVAAGIGGLAVSLIAYPRGVGSVAPRAG
jgi:hypothetical protein